MTPHILISAAMDSPTAAKNYEAAVCAAGGTFETRYCPEIDLSFDGLLLTGGGDIESSHYGRANEGSMPPDSERDRTELALCKAYLEAGKPILGVCRGHQVINVTLGGTMIQDLGELLNRFHRRVGPTDKAHTIWAKEGGILHSLYGPQFGVNSAHHQAVEDPGQGLVVTARSEAGIVESMELPGRPVLGVQFHPERMTGSFLRADCVDGAAIFRWFIGQCRE